MLTEMKYEFTGKTKLEKFTNSAGEEVTCTVNQIRALRDIPRHGVKMGDVGGYIFSEENLSHEGDCWLGHGVIRERAKVSGDVLISGGGWRSHLPSIQGSSVIHCTGKIIEAVVFDSKITGDVDIDDTSIHESTIEAKKILTTRHGLIEKTSVLNWGNGEIFLERCFLKSDIGELKIISVDDGLHMNNVHLEVRRDGTDKIGERFDSHIMASGKLEDVYAEDILQVNLNGKLNMKHVFLNEGTELVMHSGSEYNIQGISKARPVKIINGRTYLNNANLDGYICLSGNLLLKSTNLSGYAMVENQTNKILTLREVSMNDFTSILLTKTHTDEFKIQGKTLTEDQSIVL